MHFNNWPQKKFPLIEHSTPGNTLGASIIWEGAQATQWKNSSLNQVVVCRISRFKKRGLLRLVWYVLELVVYLSLQLGGLNFRRTEQLWLCSDCLVQRRKGRMAKPVPKVWQNLSMETFFPGTLDTEGGGREWLFRQNVCLYYYRSRRLRPRGEGGCWRFHWASSQVGDDLECCGEGEWGKNLSILFLFCIFKVTEGVNDWLFCTFCILCTYRVVFLTGPP